MIVLIETFRIFARYFNLIVLKHVIYVSHNTPSTWFLSGKVV